jgi:hypothetical protein
MYSTKVVKKAMMDRSTFVGIILDVSNDVK